jgi:hypothetical protein
MRLVENKAEWGTCLIDKKEELGEANSVKLAEDSEHVVKVCCTGSALRCI